MAVERTFPFELRDSFFTRLHFSRKPSVPNPLHLAISAQVKIEASQYPSFEVFLKLQTQEAAEQPVSIELELVGQFGLHTGEMAPESDLLVSFLNERALLILWTYADQQIRSVTSQMGMNAIKLGMPGGFGVTQKQLDEAATSAQSP